jgi:hypothetical protein
LDSGSDKGSSWVRVRVRVLVRVRVGVGFGLRFKTAWFRVRFHKEVTKSIRWKDLGTSHLAGQ